MQIGHSVNKPSKQADVPVGRGWGGVGPHFKHLAFLTTKAKTVVSSPFPNLAVFVGAQLRKLSLYFVSVGINRHKVKRAKL